MQVVTINIKEHEMSMLRHIISSAQDLLQKLNYLSWLTKTINDEVNLAPRSFSVICFDFCRAYQ